MITAYFVTVNNYQSNSNFGSYLSLSCTTIEKFTDLAVSEKRWKSGKSNIESTIRNMITSNKIDEVTTFLTTLNSSYLPNGRNIIYVITEVNLAKLE